MRSGTKIDGLWLTITRISARVSLRYIGKGELLMNDERRHYQRVSFDTTAKLSTGDQTFDCQIVDLSIHGVLLRPHGVLRSKTGTQYNLEIPLSDQQSSIKMSLKLLHQAPENLGFVCESIDLDSITHLRKIVELNSGDTAILERDLTMLCNENS